MYALVHRLESLWRVQSFCEPPPTPPSFYFSETMKHSKTVVSNNKVSIQGFGMALVEPALSSHKPSQITFRTDSLSFATAIGVCFDSVVSQKAYKIGKPVVIQLERITELI